MSKDVVATIAEISPGQRNRACPEYLCRFRDPGRAGGGAAAGPGVLGNPSSHDVGVQQLA
jgi:hypothetical protein